MARNPDCADCQGTGWREVERDGLRAVVRCGCTVAAPTADRLERSGVPPRFVEASFDNFRCGHPGANPIEYNQLTAAIMLAKKFAAEYPLGGKKGLLLRGRSGVGKTHLAVAALRTLLDRGFEGVFFDYQTLLQRIRESYDAFAGSATRAAYRAALDAEVLLLDDLGAHRATDWVYDTVTAIINERYNSEKAILVTTNLPIEKLGETTLEADAGAKDRTFRDRLEERIGERGVSRLIEMCRVVSIDARDYRLRR